MNEAICMLSGGVDSTTLLYAMFKEFRHVEAISFNYGQRHVKELLMAKRTCDKLGIEHLILDMSKMCEFLFVGNALTDNVEVPEGHYEDETMRATVVPNRNSIMINLAMAYGISKNIRIVGYAAHCGDHAIYPDCRPAFLKAIRALASVVDYEPVIVFAPFMNISKVEIVKLGVGLGVDYSLTWSCYKGGDKSCGKCGTCIERKEAFAGAGIEDPLEYEVM